MPKKPSASVEVTEVTEVTLRGVEGFFPKVVTKFGTGAMVVCPKRYLGREVYVIIRRPVAGLTSEALPSEESASPASHSVRSDRWESEAEGGGSIRGGLIAIPAARSRRFSPSSRTNPPTEREESEIASYPPGGS